MLKFKNMPNKTKLVTLYRGGFSSEVPTFDSNGTDIDVSKFLKINIAVPQSSGSAPHPTITFEQYQEMMENGTFTNNTVYEVTL